MEFLIESIVSSYLCEMFVKTYFFIQITDDIFHIPEPCQIYQNFKVNFGYISTDFLKKIRRIDLIEHLF